MNQKVELSPKQIEVLICVFQKKNGRTVFSVSKELGMERALANNICNALIQFGLINEYGGGMVGVSREGRDKLIELGVPGAERKIGVPAKLGNVPKVLKDITLEELESAKPAKMQIEPEPELLIPHGFTGEGLKNDKTHRISFRPEPVSVPKSTDFDTLVRQGLDRLNERLGRPTVEIENADLKVETLQKLSDSAWEFSEEVAALLKQIANDIQRCSGGSK
jgi:hypothetical protein